MSIVAIGLNHHTATLETLERLAIPASRLPKALGDLRGRNFISEAVVLSTCNRTEVYVRAEKFHGGFADVRDFLAEVGFLAPEDLADSLYTFHDDEAVNHLFSVCAGIDSVVLGEHEIQGQVKVAWQAALDEDTSGPVLNSLFRQALEVGKRARTETAIGRHITSVSAAAVAMANARLGSLDDHRIFVLGAGEMGGGMGEALLSASPTELVVASRTWARASDLAERIGGRAVHLDTVESELLGADVLFTSTSAASYMLEHDQVASIMTRREGRPLLIVDIAMPRDVDPAAAEVEGVTLIDMEGVRSFTDASRDARQSEVEHVSSIIDQELSRYRSEVASRRVAPLIAKFRDNAEELRSSEFARFDKDLADLSEGQREAVDKLTRNLLAKLLHTPTVRLKDAAESPEGDRLAAALRDLFDLS